MVIFEPHTYSRTRDLTGEFATAFTAADEVVLAPVFASRETGDDSAVLALFGEIKKHNAARYFTSYDEINRYVAGVLTSGDLALYTGAGTINRAAEKLVSDYGDMRE